MEHPVPKTERELALWMLAKMKASAAFLETLRASRNAGVTDVLDTPLYRERHKARLGKLYTSDEEEEVETTTVSAASIAHLEDRDLLSGREEFIEKALAAYLAQAEHGDAGLPADWATTFETAEAHVNGAASGRFPATFTAELAAMARVELAREAARGKTAEAERE